MPLQEPVSMSIYDLDGIWVGDRDVVGLYPDYLAILLMKGVDRLVSLAPATLIHKP
jgi:hypothetical protein